ncbi:MAG: TonB family protein [Pyrinomonadaceae bacterium]
MKICPTCQTEFIDTSMRFCTKDGTPLITFTPPVVEEPLISTPIPTPTPEPPSLDATLSDIPMPHNRFTEEPTFDPAVRLDPDSDFDSNFPAAEESNEFNVQVDEPQQITPVTPAPIPATITPDVAPEVAITPPTAPPKRKSNVALFAILGILGLLGLLGIVGAAGAYWYFSSNKQVAVANNNANTENVNDVSSNDNSDNLNDNNNSADTNTNDNQNVDANQDANLDTNLNINGIAGINANTRPSPTPRSSPSPSPRNTNRNANQVIEIEPSQPSPTPDRQTPTPPQIPQGSKTVAGGVVNGRATSLPKPPYPAAARAVRAEGQVNVQVLIDENGNVVSASAISGNPLLRQAAAQAARQAKFSRTVISGQPVKVSGVIIYNFTMN